MATILGKAQFQVSRASTEFASLDAAIAALGASRAVLTLVPGDTKTLTDDLTIPANITLDPRMGVIATNGHTLTVEGDCPEVNWQVFDVSGGGGVTGLKRANPRMFGAVADNTTDCRAAFQAADDSADEVIVRAGQYLLSGVVECSVSWRGEGTPRVRVVQDGTAEKSILSVRDYEGERLDISGFDLRGGYDGLGTDGEFSHAIRLSNSKNVYIHGNYIEAPYGDCVYVGSLSAADLGVNENIHVYDNVLRNPRRCAIGIVSARRIWVRDNYIEDPYNYVATIDLEPSNNGVQVVEDVWIENNYVNGRAYFVKLVCPTANDPIRNVTVRGNRGSPLFLVVATGFGTFKASENVVIEDNEVWSVVGDERAWTISNVVRGLVIRNNRDYTLNPSGSYVQNAADLVLEGNRVYPDTTFTSGGVNARTLGIVIDTCPGAKVRGNIVRGVAGNSSNGSFRIIGNCSGAEFIGNDVEGAVAAYVFTDVVTDVLFDSRGEASGALITVGGVASDIRIGKTAKNRGAGTFISGSANLLFHDTPEISRSGVREVWGTAAPTSGTWVEGSVVRNTTLDSFKNISHWICIVGGTPGTWRAFGTGRGSTANRPSLASGDAGYLYYDTDLGQLIHWNGTGWDT